MTGGGSAAAERLTHVGASHVLFTLEHARARILRTIFPEAEPTAGVFMAAGPR